MPKWDDDGGSRMSGEMEEQHNTAKRPSAALTIDRAAFLLLRVKKAFKKKRQQRKEKNAAAAAAAAAEALGGTRRAPPPLLRSRTLPAIIAPGFSILHAQIDPRYQNDLAQSQNLTRGISSSHRVGGLLPTPRVSFTSKDGVEAGEVLDLRRKSASSRLGGSSPRSSLVSAGTELERNPDGSIALRVPGPITARAFRSSVSGGSTGAPLQRLARLLHQAARPAPATPPDDDNTVRRLSWERRDQASTRLPRSSSIDSMVEAVWAESSEPRPEPAARADRALSLVSPSVGRRTKGQRGVAGKCLHKKWTHVRDNWMKSYKRIKLTSKGGIRSRKYIYHEQMSFLKKIASFKPSQDQEFGMNNFEGSVETILVEPNSPLILKKRRFNEQRTPHTYPSFSVDDGMQPDSNRHMSFFRGILPSLNLLDEDETLEFQIGILNLIKDLKKNRYTQGHMQYGEYNNYHIPDITETTNMDSDEDKKIFSPSSSQNDAEAVE